ncbi:MAG: aminotransferase class V-fold PLP-dependent enzyme [Aggregatilineales bacterium]
MAASTTNSVLATDPLLQWRGEFPILQDCTYLVSNSLGAMPRGVYDSLRAYADFWATRGVRAWGEGWWDLNVAVGNRIAPIVGAAPDTISMHQSVSLALGILLSCFSLDGPRHKVVSTDMIFPSVYYVWREILPPSMRLELVPSNDGIGVDLDRLIDAIDEDTMFVSLDHVFFRTAYIVDAARVIEKAHQVGARVILDAYHSVGIVPLDVTALNVDYMLAGVLKWMCGGPGGVFLYARPDHLRTLRPKLTGWMAHKRPFGFEVDAVDYREDAFRMLNGTPAVPSLYAIQPSIDVIGKVTVDAIRQKSMRQTALLIELSDAAGFAVNSPRDPTRRGGTVTVNPKNSYEVSRELLARNIVIDYRPNAGIRISPHFYNTDDEIRFAIAQIQDIVDSGAWQRHANSHDFVT